VNMTEERGDGTRYLGRLAEIGRSPRAATRFAKAWLAERGRVRRCARLYERLEKDNPGNYYSLNAFDYYRCIFVHVPKTGGISVSKSLFGNYSGGHYEIEWYRRHYQKRTFSRYFKFSFVRNPWDRLYSAFNFLGSGGFHSGDQQWFEENLAKYTCFDDFVLAWLSTETVRSGHIHFRPQHRFLCSISGELLVDFVGRFESLEQDYEFVRQRIGGGADLKHLNSSRQNTDYARHYSREAAERVARVYSRDIELFGYSFADR
jgi:hypothetical protein